MGISRRVNDALSSVTGYRVTKVAGTSAPSQGERRGQARPEQPKQRKARAPKRPRGEDGRRYPKDFDDAAIATIELVRPRTMTSKDKLFALVSAVRYVAEHDVPGDIVECGVWRGGSMQAVARTLLEAGDTSRDLYLFDTFEGMPPPSEQDVRRDGAPAAQLLASTPRREGSRVWAYASREDVQTGMAEIGYPAERVHLRQGKVEDTVPAQAPDQISILRLDTDWYSSTKHELDHLYDRLVPGGVLLIDDYGYWQGSRTATDEFIRERKAKLLLLRMSSGRIAVKPRT
jgi:O-methyltransferase